MFEDFLGKLEEVQVFLGEFREELTIDIINTLGSYPSTWESSH
ncbi:hypothetical protein [Propionibacterium sp. oral taxon 192]|nr:hypothetical protein [Propionibacterium sp. oral taxon 192]